MKSERSHRKLKDSTMKSELSPVYHTFIVGMAEASNGADHTLAHPPVSPRCHQCHREPDGDSG